MTILLDKKRKVWIGEILEVQLPDIILVFGSNPEGRHGKGMAKTALKLFNAIYGKGFGLQGRSYAIVTKNLKKCTVEDIFGDTITFTRTGRLSVDAEYVERQIKKAYETVRQMPDFNFIVGYQYHPLTLSGFTGD